MPFCLYNCRFYVHPNSNRTLLLCPTRHVRSCSLTVQSSGIISRYPAMASNSVRVAAVQMTSINDLAANFATCSRLAKLRYSFSLLKQRNPRYACRTLGVDPTCAVRITCDCQVQKQWLLGQSWFVFLKVFLSLRQRMGKVLSLRNLWTDQLCNGIACWLGSRAFGCHLEDFKKKDLMMRTCATHMLSLMTVGILEAVIVKYICKMVNSMF
ncbi:hypothetical protein POTOM_031038 [Populus tomentosa]|uniref:Uncharacterized protein n=1 Tax=Populus tomentosa TaxID=118781 RepID=A0A8X8CI68_POPTO|nr:hypothetical protein POTOM_031038 [Populus tomentosa]